VGKLGVLLVHGMGNHEGDYADETIRDLQAHVERGGHDPRALRFEAAYWSDILDTQETDMAGDLSGYSAVFWRKIRREIVIGGFGDVLAYTGPPKKPSIYYDRIHACITESLVRLRDRLDAGPDAPLVVLAHSLGSVIVSDYLWDGQHGQHPDGADDPFTRGETVASLVTFGSNIPLFTLALPRADVTPIDFPGARARACFPGASDEDLDIALRWLNFYDKDDLLGFPLRPVNDLYARAVAEDREIDTGWVVASHTSYWTDDSFTKPVAKQLGRLLALLD